MTSHVFYVFCDSENTGMVTVKVDWISEQPYSKKLIKLQPFWGYTSRRNTKCFRILKRNNLSYSMAKTIDRSENTGRVMVKVDWISQPAYSKNIKEINALRL